VWFTGSEALGPQENNHMMSNNDRSKRNQPLAVTGIGVYTPMGKSVEEFWQRIDSGECSVREIRGFDISGLSVKHAAEIVDHNPDIAFPNSDERNLDWTAQFGILAARQALADAQVEESLRNSERFGLVVGVCAGGQGDSPLQRTPESTFDIALDRFPETSLYRQTDAIGRSLGIHGPRSTVSTACASSGSALGYAFELLQSGDADAILVGGTDAFSISTYAGFYALGAMPEKPISPFSDNIGVSFGEGAGFVVLEPLERAQARGAKIYGLLLGYGCTGDAHHVTSPHPSGEGLQRAMAGALQRAGRTPKEIDYLNAHGTATRDNDRAESSAIRELFKESGTIPPVSSNKSQFGHTLGAAGILEFIVSILAQREGRIPPTVNFVSPRPGCDLDYVPNESRPGKINTFLSNSAAFGGINVSVLGATADQAHHESPRHEDEIWITGIGVISSIGSGVEAFREGLLQKRCGINKVSEFSVDSCRSRHAGLVTNFNARKLAPTIDVRRTDPLNRYAMVAAALALKHAKLEVRAANCARVGMVMSLNYGSIAVQERFRESLINDGIEKLSAKFFPSMVVSTVGGTVAQSFNLRGFNSTVVDGITGGLAGLVHAATSLRNDASQDAVVLVAADEVASLLFHTFDSRGWLAPTDGDGSDTTASLGAYDQSGKGLLLGEGGISLILERAEKAKARGAVPLAKLSGHALTSDATLAPEISTSSPWLSVAIESALRRAEIAPQEIDLVYGHGRGLPEHDRSELSSLAQVFGSHRPPLGNVLGNTGVASASSGLFSVAAAILGIQHGEAYPVVGTAGDMVQHMNLVREPLLKPLDRVLVIGSTENGNHTAVVLSKVESN
jgi:3-oxoacyl-[acyl-carrier-protein] synthase II